MIDQNEAALLRVIRAVLLGEALPVPEIPDWAAILQEARAQTVLGLIAEAVPEGFRDAVRTEDSQLKAKFMRILHGQTQLVSLFRAAGIPLVILKGMAAAMYDPKPARRAMGDVDFLVPQDRFSAAVQLLEANGYEPLGELPDEPPRHLQYAKGGVEYELHHHFSSFDLDLEPIVTDGLSRAVTHEIAGREFPTLPNPENALVLLAHIRQHLLESGLGLRQIIDWLQCLKCLTAEETAQLQAYAKETNLYTLACTINQICNHHLGTSFDWGETVDPETEDALLEHLFTRGNFGRKLGSDRPVEAVSLSVREQGLFPYLQSMGMLHWEAAQKHAFLRPFAWMHTVGRYAKKGTRLLFHSPDQVQDQFTGGRKINSLLRKLGLL